jgi:hypothetical protein
MEDEEEYQGYVTSSESRGGERDESGDMSIPDQTLGGLIGEGVDEGEGKKEDGEGSSDGSTEDSDDGSDSDGDVLHTTDSETRDKRSKRTSQEESDHVKHTYDDISSGDDVVVGGGGSSSEESSGEESAED